MIEIFTTGGTIDKIYFDAKSDFQVGDSPLNDLLQEANLTVTFKISEILRKDSLEMTNEDRAHIRERVAASASQHIVITHGTDTMVETGKALAGIPAKTIVLTGAMQPARFRATDALFNVAAAITAAQTLPPGVYIAMNGQIFDPQATRKNVAKNRFEPEIF
ncbi:MAG: asparaginase [Deltaproteobacteria bacterium]|nr:asparaginase [Deltaproteobacteria bacterium]NCP03756.1 asparaginase [Deltaproteobacteria bacterium]